MNAKEIVVYVTNAVVALAVLGLVFKKIITWEMALGAIALLLVPSAGHVVTQRLMTEDK